MQHAITQKDRTYVHVILDLLQVMDLRAINGMSRLIKFNGIQFVL